jgi:hypothetical protein
MLGYYKLRFLTTLAVLSALVAAYFWYRVDDMVARSPYWAQSPASAKAFGVFIASASAPDHLSIPGGTTVPITSVWREHSYSYRRSGPFTAAVVINKDEALHVLSAGPELIRSNMRGGLEVCLDSERLQPVFASTGALVGPFPSGAKDKHRLSLVRGEQTLAECEIIFSPQP